MNCSEVSDLLHPFFDGELDAIHSVHIEEHLATCASCQAQLERLQGLRRSLAAPELYYRAGAACRDAVVGSIGERHVVERRLSRPMIAAIFAVAACLFGVAVALFGPSFGGGSDRLTAFVVAAHIRSLQAEHLFDVPSTDSHTVKPWFRGKLDFSPQVPDFAQEGFPLAGGRLDYLDDCPAAALVYRHAKHVINVFTWPMSETQSLNGTVPAHQGFNIRRWQQGGMNYWAVSDVSGDRLDEFVRLFQTQQASAPAR